MIKLTWIQWTTSIPLYSRERSWSHGATTISSKPELWLWKVYVVTAKLTFDFLVWPWIYVPKLQTIPYRVPEKFYSQLCNDCPFAPTVSWLEWYRILCTFSVKTSSPLPCLKEIVVWCSGETLTRDNQRRTRVIEITLSSHSWHSFLWYTGQMSLSPVAIHKEEPLLNPEGWMCTVSVGAVLTSWVNILREPMRPPIPWWRVQICQRKAENFANKPRQQPWQFWRENIEIFHCRLDVLEIPVIKVPV